MIHDWSMNKCIHPDFGKRLARLRRLSLRSDLASALRKSSQTILRKDPLTMPLTGWTTRLSSSTLAPLPPYRDRTSDYNLNSSPRSLASSLRIQGR